jgi:hypothetical protein
MVSIPIASTFFNDCPMNRVRVGVHRQVNILLLAWNGSNSNLGVDVPSVTQTHLLYRAVSGTICAEQTTILLVIALPSIGRLE